GASGGGKVKGASTPLLGRGGRSAPSLSAAPKGATSNDIELEVASAADDAPDGTFTLKVRSPGAAEEVYENVTLGKKGGKGTPEGARNVVEAVAERSKLITLTEVAGQGSLAERTPNVGTTTIKAQAAAPAQLPQVRSQQFIGDAGERSGIEGLEIADDVTMVCAPDLYAAFPLGPDASDAAKRDAWDTVKGVQLAMTPHAERMGDRIAIIDAPPNLKPQEVKRWRQVDTNFDSKYAAMYYPWITVDGPDGQSIDVPPCGHIAGIYARS